MSKLRRHRLARHVLLTLYQRPAQDPTGSLTIQGLESGFHRKPSVRFRLCSFWDDERLQYSSEFETTDQAKGGLARNAPPLRPVTLSSSGWRIYSYHRPPVPSSMRCPLSPSPWWVDASIGSLSPQGQSFRRISPPTGSLPYGSYSQYRPLPNHGRPRTLISVS